MLDSKITLLKNHFGITRPEDWHDVYPHWILAIDGVGPVTLEHIRIYLAARNLTLKDDRTPEYWREHLAAVKIGHVMGDEELNPACDRGFVCPFTVLIDSAEQHPFLFAGIIGDAADKNRPIIITTEWKSLGRHPDSLGDYSLTGGEGRCHVERKSMADAHSTILGFGDGHRERFERELANLSQIEAGLVVVECSLSELLANAPQWGKRTRQQNAKALHRSILAFAQDYSVPFLFCDSRRLAELTTFRWLKRWHDKQAAERKAGEREAAKERREEAAERAEMELLGL